MTATLGMVRPLRSKRSQSRGHGTVLKIQVLCVAQELVKGVGRRVTGIHCGDGRRAAQPRAG